MKRLACALLALILCLALAACDLSGGTTVKVATDGMSPLFEAGDVIRCDPVEDPQLLTVGDIIAYWTVIDGERVSYVSRIVAIYDGEGYLLFETRDDNSASVNPLTVHQSEIIGVYAK